MKVEQRIERYQRGATTLSITTFSITNENATLSITFSITTKHTVSLDRFVMLGVTFLMLYWMWPFCVTLHRVSLRWVLLCWVSLYWLSLRCVAMLSVVMLSVIMVSVVMLSVVMLSDAASSKDAILATVVRREVIEWKLWPARHWTTDTQSCVIASAASSLPRGRLWTLSPVKIGSSCKWKFLQVITVGFQYFTGTEPVSFYFFLSRTRSEKRSL